MTVTTFATSTATQALARVNLLPPEIREERVVRRVQVGLGLGLAGCAAVVGLLYTAAHHSVTAAQADLDQATAQRTALQSDVARLNSVSQVYAQVASREAMLTRLMGDEVQWSHYMNDLSLTVPSNVWLTSVTITQTAGAPAGPTSAAGAGAPVFDAGIGTITFNGVAMSHDDVAVWLESLAKEKGYANAYFTNSTEVGLYSHKVYNFTSSVTVTPGAYSGRFSKPAGS
ncbi:MAG: type pilus assembly protein PilN [Frankiales bacterium]|jgi:Tfp pilus assembly protein PilN|nr:type pilus assembly protein PilN [Frankiales bacterium]MDX6274870.1 type pilus assembly protein PilN [Frankiales bacterium]